MATAKRIAKNSLYIFSGNIFGAVIQLILIVYMVRYLGAEAFGKYSFAASFSSIFAILLDLGLSVLSIREISKNTQKAGEYLSNILIIKTVLSFVTLILIFTAINLMRYPPDTTLAVYIFAGIIVLSSFTSSFKSIFRAFERMQYEAVISITEKILVFVLVMSALLYGYGLIGVILAMLMAQAMISLIAFITVLKKFTRPFSKFDAKLSRKLLKEALPFGIASVFSVIYFQTDTIMLSMMKGDIVVGWYGAAYRLVMGTLFVPIAFVAALYPVLSKSFTSSKEEFIKIFKKGFKLLAIFAIPLGIGTTLLADKIIELLYGNEFTESIVALQILIWVASLMSLYMIVGHVLASMNRQKIDTYVTGVSAILNVVLNFMLIPKYGLVGAGIASIFSQIFVLLLELRYLKRLGYDPDVLQVITKPLTAGVIMGFWIYAVESVSESIIIISVTALIIYIFILYLLKTFDGDELEILKTIIKK